MKILFCTSSMGKGGAERVISVLANEFIKKHEIIILVNTLKGKAYKTENAIKEIALDNDKVNKSNFIRNIKRIISTYKVIKEEKPDLIISFLLMPSFRVLALKRILKTPIIVSDRNDPKQEYKSFISKCLMKCLYKKADGFVFQTKEQQRYFNKNIQKKSCIIPNPIKNEFLEENEERIKEKTIITVGRLVEQKNHQMLINAFEKIHKDYPEYKLKIFGEGPLREKLQQNIKNMNMEEYILLCGVSDNIKKELLKSEIFALPSNYEGMPNALLEAMAVGLPCISTDCPCGGPKELINNGENGLLIDVNNEVQLIESIRMLICNKEKATIIGRNAKKIKQSLNIENICYEWEKYITKIVRG